MPFFSPKSGFGNFDFYCFNTFGLNDYSPTDTLLRLSPNRQSYPCQPSPPCGGFPYGSWFQQFLLHGGELQPPIRTEHVCRPRHKGHDDQTSSSPSSWLPSIDMFNMSAVGLESPTKCWQLSLRVTFVIGLNHTPHGTN
ncbi:4241_t:CDS:2 [Funneliformis geosporum]|nr:4241_t:CDS:2 [Funneliformis geosporum]